MPVAGPSSLPESASIWCDAYICFFVFRSTNETFSAENAILFVQCLSWRLLYPTAYSRMARVG